MTHALSDLAWPRRTDRLAFRRLVDGDADDAYALRSDPATNRWTSRLFTARADFDQAWEERKDTDLAVTWHGRLAGLLMVRVCDAWAQAEVADRARGQQAELGWTVAPWCREQGVGTEVAREGLAIAFELGVRRVEASCFLDNVASWRIMEKVGMRRETHSVKESLHRSGEWLDGLTYAILADEYYGRRRAAWPEPEPARA